MRNGTVKFWHEKGWAWIIDDITGKDIYTNKKLLHSSETRLLDGKRVEYEFKEKCGRGANETHAINVKHIY